MKTLALLHHAVSSVRRALATRMSQVSSREECRTLGCTMQMHHASHTCTLSSAFETQGALQRLHGSSL